MKNLFDLSGKVAIITGSTRGIGKAIAEAYAAHGAKVVISSRKADVCEDVAKAIRADGGEAVAIPCNVSHKEQLEELVAKTRSELGAIDVLVANAAVNPHYGSALEIPDSAFEKILRVNIQSNHWLVQLIAPEMIERKSGSIIFLSSIGGMRASTTIGTYNVSKAADMQLARNLAAELGQHGIRVNCIAPGLVKTDFARALWENEKVRTAFEGTLPMRRTGEPEDLAGIAVYLASDASSWTTGQTFVIDGGATV